jgi:hypothetical protein
VLENGSLGMYMVFQRGERDCRRGELCLLLGEYTLVGSYNMMPVECLTGDVSFSDSDLKLPTEDQRGEEDFLYV